MFVWDGKCNTFKMKCFSKFFFLNIFDNVFFFSSNSNTLQIKKPFFFTGTKTVGLSLSASYDPNIDVPDPQKSERAYLKIDRKRRAARRAARRAERVESVLSVPGTMEEYQEFYEELNDISSEGLTREQQLARLACTIEEAKTQNAARSSSSSSSSTSSSSSSSSSSRRTTNNGGSEEEEEDEHAGVTSAIGNIQGCEAGAIANVVAARQFLDSTPQEREADVEHFAIVLGYEATVGTCSLLVLLVLPLLLSYNGQNQHFLFIPF